MKRVDTSNRQLTRDVEKRKAESVFSARFQKVAMDGKPISAAYLSHCPVKVGWGGIQK